MPEKPSDPLIGAISAEKAIVGRDVHVGHLYMGASTPARPRLSINLPPLNAKIVRRAGLLKEVHHAFSRVQERGVVTQVGLVGPGGIGKTSVALGYGWSHLDDFPGGVYFLNCNVPGPVLAMAGLAEVLEVSPTDTPERTAAAVRRELESGKAALLIFDNVLDNDTWQEWCQSGVIPAGPVRRLITSRDEIRGLTNIPVGNVTKSEGIEILVAHRPDARKRVNKGWAERLVTWFDGMAVGLSVAGAYMALNPKVSWKDYANDLEARDDLQVYRRTEQAVGRLAYEKRIDAVFDDLLSRLPQAERRALEYAALLPEDWVVPAWLSSLLQQDGVELPDRPGYSGGPAQPTLEQLLRRQLLAERGPDGRALSLHRVLGRHLRERLAATPEVHHFLTARVAVQVREAATALDRRLSEYTDDWEFTPLVQAFAQVLPGSKDDGLAQAAIQIANRLKNLARFREAETLLRILLAIQEKALGADHPDTAAFLNNLGYVVRGRGDIAGARALYERSLAIREKALGPDHPDTANSLNNLGHVFTLLGDTVGAQVMFERVLAIYDKAFGPEHPHTASSLNNLADVLKAQGHLAAARPLFERALAIYEMALGPDHPQTALGLNNLALVFFDLGEFARGRPLCERALAINEKAVGPDHPQTALSLVNLGALFDKLGEPTKAKGYFERSLAIYEKVLGPEHLDMAVSLNNLATVLSSQGDQFGALVLYERVLAINEKALGPEHPLTALVLNNLGITHHKLGDSVAARPLCERSLTIYEKIRGPDHPDTAFGLNSLGAVLYGLGDLAGARARFERALAIREKTLGVEHPKSVNSRALLRTVLNRQRRSEVERKDQ
jgi:tetratricopeptide (TPR) repeat protein